MSELTEPQAFSLLKGLKGLQGEQHTQAVSKLTTYRKRQEELGLPYFPSMDATIRTQRENVSSVFTDLTKVDEVVPRLRPVLQGSVDPDGDRRRAANVLFLAQETGMSSEDVTLHYPKLVGAFAQKVFGQDIKDDTAFYSAAQAHLGKRKAAQDAEQEAAKMAVMSVATGKSDPLADYLAWAAKGSANNTFGVASATAFVKAHAGMSQVVRKHKQLIDSTIAGLSGGYNTELALKIVDLPPQERGVVLAAVMAASEQKGEEGKPKTTLEGALAFTPQTGKAFARTLTDFVGIGAEKLPLVAELDSSLNAPQTGRFSLPTKEIKTPQEAFEWTQEKLTELFFARDPGLAEYGNPFKVKEDRIMRAPTAAEKELLKVANAKAKKAALMGLQLQEASRSADPISNVFSSAIGSSLVALPAAAAGPGGWVALAQGYSNSEYKRLVLNNPTMRHEDATLISGVSGVAMTALDKLEVGFLKGKMPSLNTLLNSGFSASLLKRVGVRGVEGVLFENVQEGLQDLSTAAVQEVVSRLKADVPAVDWDNELLNWKEGRADIALGTIPLVLIGTGVGTYRDVVNASKMMVDNQLLGQAGFIEQDRVTIIDLATAGKLEEAQEAVRKAYSRRMPEVAAEFMDAAEPVVAPQAGVAEEGLPTFTANNAGWEVEFPDGRKAQVQTWDEAKALAGMHQENAMSTLIDATAQMGQAFMRQGQDGEVVELSPSKSLTVDEQVGSQQITEDQAMRQAVIAAEFQGVPREEATEQMQVVFGRNVSEARQGMMQSVSQLYAGANPLTVVEEVVEGRYKKGLGTAFTPEEVTAWIRTAEEATGQKFLVDTSEQGITEAVSAIVVADVLGSRKDGATLAPGVVTNGVTAAIRLGQEGGSKLTKFSAFLGSFRQFFHQVFSRASAIRKAKKEGKLGADYQSFVDKLLGVDTTAQEQNEVASQAADLAGITPPAETQEVSTVPVGSYVSYNEYSGRLERDGERYVVKTPGREVELTAEDVVEVRLLEPDQARAVFLADLGATTPNVVESQFTPVVGELAIQDPSGRKYYPQNKKLSRSVVDTEDGPSLRVRSEANKITMLRGPQAAQAIDALLEAAVAVEQSGRKVSFALGKQSYSDAIQAELDRTLNRDPARRREFHASILARVTKLAAEFDEVAERDFSKKEIKAQAEAMESARYFELVQQLPTPTTQEQRDDAAKQAKKEAGQWRKDAIAAIPTDRERITANVRLFNAALMGLPAEMRGKVGGVLSVVDAKTPKEAVQAIKERFEKMAQVIETHLKKEYRQAIKELVNSARIKTKTGERPRSDIGPEATEFIRFAKSVMGLSEAEVQREMDTREAQMLNPTTTLEQKGVLQEQLSILDLAGNLKQADTLKLQAIYETLERVHSEGYIGWQARQKQLKADAQQFLEDLKAGTGITADQLEQRLNEEQSRFGLRKFAKNLALNLSSFHQTMRAGFGDTAAVRRLVDMERNTDNDYLDLQHQVESKVEGFFTALAGGLIAGQHLRFDMAKPGKVDTGKGLKLSIFQATQALLMWRQPDGRRHMEGKFDDKGTQLTSWAYDQAWVDNVEAQVDKHPHAKMWMKFVSDYYNSSFTTLNELYKEREGVALPQNPLYAPLTLDPQNGAPDFIDPATGMELSTSALSFGFFKARSTTAVTRPKFSDSLQVFLAHTKGQNYWIARYEFVKLMHQFWGNKESQDYINATLGKTGHRMISKWVDMFAQMGLRDASVGFEVNGVLTGMLNRASSAALLGRLSTLMVQTTQLAAASTQMPIADFARMQAKLYSGQLDWGKTFNSPFIQRRVAQKSPIIRQALQDLGTARKPGVVKHQLNNLGQLLSDTDGFSTAATYTMVYHYQLEQAQQSMGQAEAETFAAAEAERITEAVAQPVRQATRSLMELTTQNPLGKVSWAFASESRQKVAMLAWSMSKSGGGSAKQAAKTAFLVFAVNGLFVSLLKSTWSEIRGKEDRGRWDWQNLLMSTLSAPMTGIPGWQALAETGSLFSGPARAKGAALRLLSGESWEDGDVTETLKDVELLLTALALTSETATSLAAFAHMITDAANILDNVFEKLED